MYLLPAWTLPFFQWCDGTTLSVAIRESLWLFPVIESFHLLALAVLGGAILVVDLRLWGFGLRRQPVARLARDVQPWMLGSLGVMLVSGFTLFLSEALRCYDNLPFQVKMIFLFCAILFTLTVRRRVTMREDGHISPVLARAVGTLSLMLWSGVGLSGRAIGFW
jgi:hypothetical protein